MRSIADLLFDKARRDLDMARLGYAQDAQQYADQILYLCHQAAEKAMKAALVAYAEVPFKTHDLRLLIVHLKVHDPEWSSHQDSAELLNTKGHVARYQESFSDAELSEHAILAASEILQRAELKVRSMD